VRTVDIGVRTVDIGVAMECCCGGVGGGKCGGGYHDGAGMVGVGEAMLTDCCVMLGSL
jgi:hypothetical protein